MYGPLWRGKLTYYQCSSLYHGLSQQGVWVSFLTPKPLKSTPQDTQFFCEAFLKMSISSMKFDLFHLHVIPMTFYKEIMPYFDKFIHVYGWNLTILWYPLKNWTPKNLTIANFRHPVSKSWLSLCIVLNTNYLCVSGWDGSLITVNEAITCYMFKILTQLIAIVFQDGMFSTHCNRLRHTFCVLELNVSNLYVSG